MSRNLDYSVLPGRFWREACHINGYAAGKSGKDMRLLSFPTKFDHALQQKGLALHCSERTGWILNFHIKLTKNVTEIPMFSPAVSRLNELKL